VVRDADDSWRNRRGDIAASVRDIRSVRHVQSATYKRTLAVWNRDEYFQLPNRAQAGASPMIAYFSKQIGGGVLYLWPSPLRMSTLSLTITARSSFAEGPEQELDIPPEWHEAVLYGLASRSAGIFGTTAARSGKGSALRYSGESLLRTDAR
jgi:hypothetical protein